MSGPPLSLQTCPVMYREACGQEKATRAFARGPANRPKPLVTVGMTLQPTLSTQSAQLVVKMIPHHPA
jgi:hypothetical protein